ncbi:MAG: hypothetical protein J6T10_22580 [Methanobrevibacter sp.]|nr:hypothetical protein [Methanobrevibacter sp.]
MKTTFMMNQSDVRTMCINMNLFTKGTNEQYQKMLDMCDFEIKTFDVLKIKLFTIANAINECSKNQTIENIMHSLMCDCVFTFFDFD